MRRAGGMSAFARRRRARTAQASSSHRPHCALPAPQRGPLAVNVRVGLLGRAGTTRRARRTAHGDVGRDAGGDEK